MISLDWKERLCRDTEDFYRTKLPEKFYDIEIIYNAYPLRINNNIPGEVITYVGKQIASRIAHNPADYIDFYDYIFSHKGENGKVIFALIISRALQNEPGIFFPYLEKKLFQLKDVKLAIMIVDKAISPLVRKDPAKYQKIIIKWAKKDHPSLTLCMQKLLVKIMQTHPENIPEIFQHLEAGWMQADEPMIKLNIAVLRAIFKIDPDFYYGIFNHYKHSREPVFAEILTGALLGYHPDIEEAVNYWAHSGNVHLKKFGLLGQKFVKKKRTK
ncbi:MAG: hypothetical protein K9N06_00710 [Candidatus Cloacimonetes bacterium]|nr:hypothetical protein [Candidatus Cloacimonadota bacterium]